MTVDVTCRYCQRKMQLHGQRGDLYMHWCQHCQSEQTFHEDGKPAEYSFMVGKNYCIHFWPKTKQLKIVQYKNDRPEKYVLEITVDVPPTHMTPTSMTEERVKCLILFS